LITAKASRALGSISRRCLASGCDGKICRLAITSSKRAIFERKTASDFAASLIDQRLFSQAKRLADQPLRAAFIIEGSSDDWSMLGIRREALQGALITLALIFNLAVFRPLNPKETSQILIYADHQFARLREDTPRYRIYKAKKRWTQQIHLLATLPAVGRNRAYRLPDHFGSVQACISAPARELEKVPGIGPKTAAAIRDLVSAEINQPFKGAAKAHLKAIA
jgi:ERCC4-type nuclease